MQASEFRPAAVSADAPTDGQWRRQTDNHGHGRVLVPPDLITGAPETAVTVLRERAEVAEQRADDAVTRAERTLGQLVVVQAKLAEAEDRAGDAERDAQAAWDHARAALDAAEALRRADAAQWGRGRWARLRAAWRTKIWLAVLSVGILLAADVAYWRLSERGQSVAPQPSPSSVRNVPAGGTASAPSVAGPPASEPTPPTAPMAAVPQPAEPTTTPPPAPMAAIPQSVQETPSLPTPRPAPMAAVPQPTPPPTAPAASTAAPPSSPSPAQMPTEAGMSEANRRQIQEELSPHFSY
jgi:hypothetical protein